MANKRNPLHRIRLVYRRSSLLLKCVVLVTILLSTAALITLRISILEVEARTEALRTQAAELELSNEELQERIAELGTIQSVIRIAGEKLGLVTPDTSFFRPADSTNPN
jgi:cell division protein FtsL